MSTDERSKAWQPPPWRQTTYKGMKMRSRLEAAAAALFDRYGLNWEYEPMCFASLAGQYLPDFRVTGLVDCCDDDRCHTEAPSMYVEVKPYNLVTEEVLHRSEIIWESEPGARLMVMDPHQGCVSVAPFHMGSTDPDHPWECATLQAECHLIWPDNGAPVGGPCCGALHLGHDPTALHVPLGGWDIPPGVLLRKLAGS